MGIAELGMGNGIPAREPDPAGISRVLAGVLRPDAADASFQPLRFGKPHRHEGRVPFGVRRPDAAGASSDRHGIAKRYASTWLPIWLTLAWGMGLTLRRQAAALPKDRLPWCGPGTGGAR